VRVGLNELPDRETVGGFRDGDRDMLAHEISSDLEDGTGFEKRLDPIPAVLAADPGVFESTPGGLRIVSHAIDHDAPGPNLRGNPARTLKVFSDDAGVKAISGVVGDPDRLFLGVVGRLYVDKSFPSDWCGDVHVLEVEPTA
jgi:hypothetical protein